MSVITRRLSVPELSQKVLEMAQTGVYRESVFEALKPLATKKQIRDAIAQARRFGLHSVASLRDGELGTYYQVDLVKYQSLQHLLHSPLHQGSDTDLVQRVDSATRSTQRMLVTAKVLAATLALLGAVCWWNDRNQLTFGLWSGAASVFLLWMVQKAFAKDSL